MFKCKSKAHAEYEKKFKAYFIQNKKAFLDLREKLKDKDELALEFLFYSQWRTKKNEVKKKDVTNLLKILVDQIFKALEIDDSRIFCVKAQKVNLVNWTNVNKDQDFVVVNFY